MIRFQRNKLLGVLCFGAGVVLSTIVILMTAKEPRTDSCLLNRELLLQIPYMTIQKKQLFVRILLKRIKWLFLFLVFSFTALKERIFLFYWSILGYACGSLLSLSLLQYGWNGLWISIAAVMPQIVFLIPAYVGLIQLFVGGREQHAILVKGIKYLVFFFFGIYLESYVNLWVLNLVSKII